MKVFKYGLAILIFCAIVLATPAVVPCYIFVWSPLRDLQQPRTTQQLDGSTVILADMNSYFVREVTVKEIEMEDDFPLQIDLYITEQECRNLPTSTALHEYNGTQLKNVNSTYMLAGSKVDLHILASTKSLQSKSIEFYIVAIVDSSDFDPRNTKAHRYPIKVGTNGTMEGTNITHTIHTSNYYSLIFIVPKLSVILSYEMTVEIYSINLTALDTTAFGTVRKNDDSVQAKLAHWQSYYCLIASVHSSTNVYHYIHTKVIFTLDYKKTLGLTVPLVAIWTIGLLVVIGIAICCISKYMYRRRFGYRRLAE